MNTPVSIMPARKRKISASQTALNVFFILFSAMFIFPVLMIISVSLSNEADIATYGYRLIPKQLDFSAYQFILANPGQLIDSYRTTAIFTLLGTALSMAVMTMLAYTLSQPYYRFKRQLSFMVFFTMLFGGGLVPSYILNSKYLGLSDTIWIYILPGMASAFQIIIFRTFFKGLPGAISESAKVDGASEFVVFFRIILPMSAPVLATVAVMNLLGRWNDWYTSMIYIRDPALYSLQYNLQKTLLDLQFILDNFDKLPPGIQLEEFAGIPTEGVRMATCTIVALPVLLVFPFFQKYFTKGLVVGAVKG